MSTVERRHVPGEMPEDRNVQNEKKSPQNVLRDDIPTLEAGAHRNTAELNKKFSTVATETVVALVGTAMLAEFWYGMYLLSSEVLSSNLSANYTTPEQLIAGKLIVEPAAKFITIGVGFGLMTVAQGIRGSILTLGAGGATWGVTRLAELAIEKYGKR